jgi:hypothetical protein
VTDVGIYSLSMVVYNFGGIMEMDTLLSLTSHFLDKLPADNSIPKDWKVEIDSPRIMLHEWTNIAKALVSSVSNINTESPPGLNTCIREIQEQIEKFQTLIPSHYLEATETKEELSPKSNGEKLCLHAN